jgi:hypothetical protein
LLGPAAPRPGRGLQTRRWVVLSGSTAAVGPTACLRLLRTGQRHCAETASRSSKPRPGPTPITAMEVGGIVLATNCLGDKRASKQSPSSCCILRTPPKILSDSRPALREIPVTCACLLSCSVSFLCVSGPALPGSHASIGHLVGFLRGHCLKTTGAIEGTVPRVTIAYQFQGSPESHPTISSALEATEGRKGTRIVHECRQSVRNSDYSDLMTASGPSPSLSSSLCLSYCSKRPFVINPSLRKSIQIEFDEEDWVTYSQTVT